MKIDPSLLDQLARKLADAVPSQIKDLQQDIEKNFRAVLQNNLTRLNLVTRQEFEVQAGVLARTREKLERLQLEIARLEAEMRTPPTGAGPIDLRPGE